MKKGTDDARSQVSKTVSHLSKKSLSKSELEKFFSQKKSQAEEDVKSRFSRVSKHSRTLSGVSQFKQKFLKKLDESKEHHQKTIDKLLYNPTQKSNPELLHYPSDAHMDKVEENTYESEHEILNNPHKSLKYKDLDQEEFPEEGDEENEDA